MARGDAGVVIGWLVGLSLLGLSIFWTLQWGRGASRLLMLPVAILAIFVVRAACRDRDAP